MASLQLPVLDSVCQKGMMREMPDVFFGVGYLYDNKVGKLILRERFIQGKVVGISHDLFLYLPLSLDMFRFHAI